MNPQKTYNWDAFDPVQYIEHNYAHNILDEDKIIMQSLGKRLGKLNLSGNLTRIINVGHGGNFYPDIFMQLLVAANGRIHAVEYGTQNLQYMRKTIAAGKKGNNGIWQKFEDYAATINKCYKLSLTRVWQLTRPVQQSIYSLPPNRYQAGAAFFCMESITDDYAQFILATNCFLHTIQPGGFIAIAYMAESQGYNTPGGFFPAVNITHANMHKVLAPQVKHLQITQIGSSGGARPNTGPQYSGMGLATGIKS